MSITTGKATMRKHLVAHISLPAIGKIPLLIGINYWQGIIICRNFASQNKIKNNIHAATQATATDASSAQRHIHNPIINPKTPYNYEDS